MKSTKVKTSWPTPCTWNGDFWMWNGFRRYRWFSLEFSRCPALWAGNLLPQSGLGCPSSWLQEEQIMRWMKIKGLGIFCCFFPFYLKSFRHHLLLSRVVELVFPSAAEALLSPGISPYALHGSKKLCRVRLCVLHTANHVTHQLGIRLGKDISRDRGTTLKLSIYYSSPLLTVSWAFDMNSKVTKGCNLFIITCILGYIN